MKRVFHASLAALSYAFFWTVVAAPYHFFPGEDATYLLAPKGVNYEPVFAGFIELVKFFALVFGVSSPNALLIAMITANALTLFALYLLVDRLCYLTSNPARWAPLAVAVLFGTAAWPANYLFMASYTTLAAAFGTFGWYFLVESFAIREDKTRAKIFLGLSGTAFGALFWTSPSGGVLVSLSVVAALLLLKYVYQPKGFSFAICFSAPLLGVLAAFVSPSFSSLLLHWRANLLDSNWPIAVHKFGSLPKIPFLSFFHIGFVYSPAIFGMFVLFSLLFIFLVFWERRASLSDRIVLALIAVVAAHAIVIDLLPFTKLSRSQYPLFPLLLAALVLMTVRALEARRSARGFEKQAMLGAVVYLSLFAVWGSLRLDAEVIRVKQTAAKFFESSSAGTDFYVLASDPHSDSLQGTFQVPIHIIHTLAEIPKIPGRKALVILGPHGIASGRSALHASLARDFDFQAVNLVRPPQATEILLPYYAYFPPFLLEEEVSQAFYLAGLSPDYHLARLGLTVWAWGNPESATDSLALLAK